MIERVHEAMFHWYRRVGRASPGAQALEPPGVVAAVVPATPERAVANAVLFRSPEELEAAYDEVAAAYAEIGANWTVWVQPEGREAATALLAERGHVLDADPAAMGRTLAEPPPRPPADALEDWTARGELADAGRINDRSYTFGTDSWSRALEGLATRRRPHLRRAPRRRAGGDADDRRQRRAQRGADGRPWCRRRAAPGWPASCSPTGSRTRPSAAARA